MRPSIASTHRSRRPSRSGVVHPQSVHLKLPWNQWPAAKFHQRLRTLQLLARITHIFASKIECRNNLRFCTTVFLRSRGILQHCVCFSVVINEDESETHDVEFAVGKVNICLAADSCWEHAHMSAVAGYGQDLRLDWFWAGHARDKSDWYLH